MQFPESWLREYCNPPLTTQQIADTLTMGGLEVEDLRPAAPPFDGVVVGEIRLVAQHPNADRLQVCQVDVGTGEWLNIVCGAPNARVGIRVPCALVGARLPPAEAEDKPFQIKLGQLRGVESQGMLCSARELKLADDHSGLLELRPDAPIGADLRGWLRLDDTIFTLKLTPNLAHALSVYGVARELSALTGAPLKAVEFPAIQPEHPDKLKVTVSAPDLCGRFSGRVVRGVNTRATTPSWMVERLARCGQRSVSPLVDISNYVMFEFGRPSHIFDLDKIHGSLDVRWGRPGEVLKLLNGTMIEVDSTVGVIADDQSVESLAGIMGGDATAVSDDTRNIYIEAAFWWPAAVQGRSRRYGFSTDAGHRFERGVDPAQTAEHIEYITRLVLDICGGRVGPVDDHVIHLPERRPVALRVARAAKIIGVPVDQAICVNTFERLGLSVRQSEGLVTVTPPMYRFDLEIEEDLIEELARMIGYNALPDTPPLAPVAPRLRTEKQRGSFAVRRAVAALGYQETINFSFVEERWERDLAGNADPIRLLNPIASQMSVMRSSLIGSLLQVLKFNLDRKADTLRIFELGRVFSRDSNVGAGDGLVPGIHQPMHLAGLIYGDRSGLQWAETPANVDFYDAKADVESLFAPAALEFAAATHPAFHPGRCAQVSRSGRQIGWVGELHPRWRQDFGLPIAPILFELDLAAVLERDLPVYQPVPRYPTVDRDIAVIVAEAVNAHALAEAVRSAPVNGLLRNVLIFDVYRPKTELSAPDRREKSLTLRLTLGNDEATLTEAQITGAIDCVLTSIASQAGGRLRT